MTVSLRKVGGLYFWNLGRIGGSFHIKAAPARTTRRMNFDVFGLACCAALAAAVLVPSQAKSADLASQFETVCASPAIKSEKLVAACEAKDVPDALKSGDRFKAVGIGAEVNTLFANISFFQKG